MLTAGGAAVQVRHTMELLAEALGPGGQTEAEGR